MSDTWLVLDFEGEPIATGLPTKEAAIREILMDDGYDFEIQNDGDSWWLWVSDASRNSGRYRGLVRSVFSSFAHDEDQAEAEILSKVARQAEIDWGNGRSYRILTVSERAAELADG